MNKKRAGFTTLGCPDWSLDRIIDCAAAHGFGEIELRGIQGRMKAGELTEFDDPAVKEKLAANGIKISCFGSSAMFHDDGRLEAAFEDVKDAAVFCEKHGVPYIRVFGNNITDATCPVSKQVEKIARGVARACDIAKDYGASVLLEIHGDINTHERVTEAVAQINRSNFGILWDVAHNDEADMGDFMPFYEAVKPYVRHVHLKDHIRIPGDRPRLVNTGEGEIPLIPMIKALENGGYTGYYSLEWEKKWHPDLRDAELEFAAFADWFDRI